VPAGSVDGVEVDRWSDAQPYEAGTELVADLGAEPMAADGSALDTDTGAESRAVPDLLQSEPAPEPEPLLVSDPALEPGPAPAPDVLGPEPPFESGPEPRPDAPEPEPPHTFDLAPEPLDRKLAAVAVLLEAASGCEEADMSRAAALYQEAILGCLDVADEADGLGGVDQELLRGFDGLSLLLMRKGLAEEALGVVDDAAALGLLNGGACAAVGHRDALKDRREDLRQTLFADSAQL
jgi:hypothetical protein